MRHRTTAEGLIDLVAARSYVTTATERDRSRPLDDVRTLIGKRSASGT